MNIRKWITFNFVTGSVWTLMSVFNARIVNNGSCCISPRISDQSSANDNTQRLATIETTEQHGNFNFFHFQNDQIWPFNSQISRTLSVDRPLFWALKRIFFRLHNVVLNREIILQNWLGKDCWKTCLILSAASYS